MALPLVLTLLLCSEPVAAQGIWPERAENLQELPADFPTENLRAVMRGFSRSLGVRCSYCHVGQEGEPLSTYDFASDDNPNKDRAREMLRLLGDVNERLRDFDHSGAERVNMWCHTCHAGKPKPMTLSETLSEAYAEGGGSAALQRFVLLRDRFFGGNQYDFRAPAVHEVATGLLARGDTVTARDFLSLNASHFPDFAQGLVLLGDLLLAEGDTEGALEQFERALELRPGEASIEERIRRARGNDRP